MRQTNERMLHSDVSNREYSRGGFYISLFVNIFFDLFSNNANVSQFH